MQGGWKINVENQMRGDSDRITVCLIHDTREVFTIRKQQKMKNGRQPVELIPPMQPLRIKPPFPEECDKKPAVN